MKRTWMILALAVPPLALSAAQTKETLGDTSDGSRSVPLHLIKIYDEFDHVVKPDDNLVMPFSPKQTCRKCHDYEKVRHGWHFNAADSGVRGGRAGEPWILVDRAAAVQVPLSYRGWEGTLSPKSLNLSTLQFLKSFGRHLPGGGVGEDERAQDLDDYMRWQVSGNLDVNCQSCHNADPGQSQSEYGVQVLRQNFRWAASASSGFATVQGSAGEMPDNFDLYSVVPPEKSNLLPPTVTYNKARFDVAARVLFSVVRKMPPAQCYFCHSTKVIDPAKERWEGEEDVHMAAGMTCIDCHRNGIDHQMVRGYDGEADSTGNGSAASFTCRGCHSGNGGEGVPVEGRRGAPRPLHRGLPPVHFEKLTCTVCHSGPWPSDTAHRVKTSRAHALGIPKADKADDALPHIVAPVYARQSDGVYVPQNLVWPAFWAYKGRNDLDPIPPEIVRPLVSGIFSRDTARSIGRWPVLTREDILEILQRLHERDSTRGTPVYVTGGKLFLIGADGKLLRQDHEAAKPYGWPLAHDVRPKSQSLGVRGCDDCHAVGAPFYFGSVVIASPYVVEPDSMSRMTRYQDQSPVFPWLFSMSFLFRPGLKALIIFSFLLLAAVVLIYALKGLSQILRTLSSEKE